MYFLFNSLAKSEVKLFSSFNLVCKSWPCWNPDRNSILGLYQKRTEQLSYSTRSVFLGQLQSNIRPLCVYVKAAKSHRTGWKRDRRQGHWTEQQPGLKAAESKSCHHQGPGSALHCLWIRGSASLPRQEQQPAAYLVLTCNATHHPQEPSVHLSPFEDLDMVGDGVKRAIAPSTINT